MRLFRSWQYWTGVAAGFGGITAGVAGFSMIAKSAAPVSGGSTRMVAAHETFTCTPTHVWDGDGPIWCAEGPKIRLAGIAAREMDGTCNPGHPCPDASAVDARDYLAWILNEGTFLQHDPVVPGAGHVPIHGPALTCVSTGSAGGKRTAAWCVSPSAGDLSCKMLASGYVAKWPRYWQNHRC